MMDDCEDDKNGIFDLWNLTTLVTATLTRTKASGSVRTEYNDYPPPIFFHNTIIIS